MLRVVFDSNVFISALLFNGPPRQALELARNRKIILLSSKPIIEESSRILREKFMWPEHKVKQFVRQTSRLAELQTPKKKLRVIKHEPDNRILECAVEGKAHLIISGDDHLLKLKSYKSIPIQKTKFITYLIKKA